MKHPALLALLLPALCLTAACADDQKVDIGSTGTLISDYAATWEGYVEAYQFHGGSDRLRLILDTQGRGTLRVGDAPLAPAPTDPDVGYPAGDWWIDRGDTATFLHPVVLYPVHDARIESARIRLAVHPLDAYAEWCELQTPYRIEQNSAEPIYQCVPGSGGSFDPPDNCQLSVAGPPPQSVPVDCEKWKLCTSQVCACTATGCGGAQPDPDGIVLLDGALMEAGTELVGTMVLGGRVTFRLTRQ